MNLIGSMFDVGQLVPIMIFAIPIVAIVGGITSGIVKTITEAKMLENTQRERMAALERGVDLEKLPPLPTPGQSSSEMMAGFNPIAAQRHRAQGLLIGGVITLFTGIGFATFLYFIVDGSDGERVWAIGIIPVFVGVALLLSSMLVWPRGDKA